MRTYYKQRLTGAESSRLELRDVAAMTLAAVESLEAGGWFQEAFGYYCVDQNNVRGTVPSPEAFLYQHAFVRGLWPAKEEVYLDLDEPTLFTLIEVFFDCVAQPLQREAWHHTFSGCGWHYSFFNRAEGQKRWRGEVNNFLAKYADGFELNEHGEVQRLGTTGLRELMAEAAQASVGTDEGPKIAAAVRRFRLAKSTREDRVGALKELADVLERHRRTVKRELLNKDEDELFNIANNFGIRHWNERQKTEYDGEMLSWIFHVYLATIWLVLDLGKRAHTALPEADVAPPPPDEFDYGEADDVPF